ncbi:hypothetical protein ACFLVG_03285 [Chloroflexota bacterium]
MPDPGLMIEVHHNPAEALVDGQQVTPKEPNDTIKACNKINKAIRLSRN